MKQAIVFLMVLGTVMTAWAGGNRETFHKTVDYVDMERFSGDWYVLALIPTSFEKGASNGIENYSFDEKGNIHVEYTFLKKGREKVMSQKGWIIDTETNAEWRVRPLWPLKLPYYIIELDEDYSYTAIATNNYKYLWIMSREPELEAEVLESIIDRMVQRGFDRDKIIYMEQTGAR